MGFKDGTRNIDGRGRRRRSTRYVWVGDETDQAWMRGGSYLVARRIRMLIEALGPRLPRRPGGRSSAGSRYTGAPLTGTDEFDTPDFAAKGADGEPVIPTDAHIRLAAHENNGGLRILRRGYSFTDGIDPDTGELDAGLFFIAYQKDPRTQFVPLQRKLGAQRRAQRVHRAHRQRGCSPARPACRTRGDYWASALFA